MKNSSSRKVAVLAVALSIVVLGVPDYQGFAHSGLSRDPDTPTTRNVAADHREESGASLNRTLSEQSSEVIT